MSIDRKTCIFQVIVRQTDVNKDSNAKGMPITKLSNWVVQTVMYTISYACNGKPTRFN